MKPSYFLIALSLCISFLAQAQIPMGSWKFHVASAKAIDIVTDGERVFTALENGLYIYIRWYSFHFRCEIILVIIGVK